MSNVETICKNKSVLLQEMAHIKGRCSYETGWEILNREKVHIKTSGSREKQHENTPGCM